MKNLFLLLLLLNIHVSQVHSLPYQADGNCLNPATEYKLDGSNLCCRKCQPGERLKEDCSKTSETVCEACPPGQYIENWNYSPNCFPCKDCKTSRGLLYIQNCSAQTMSKCGCKPGMYCTHKHQSCSSCTQHRLCKVGYGVSKPGTATSDVRCEKCPDGTFSDKESSTEPCRPHQRCHGRDTVCPPGVTGLDLPFPTLTKVVSTPTSAAIVGSDSAVTPADAASSISLPASEAFFNHPTKSSPLSPISHSLALIICIPVIIVLIFAALLFCWKTFWRKDAAKRHPEMDANGNCAAGWFQTNPGYFAETQLRSLIVTSPEEEECLLEKSQPSSSSSQSSRSTDALTRTENCRNSEYIGPLQSTLPVDDPHSEASGLTTFLSCTEALPPQNSIHAQSSFLPATPQIISPVTTSPHVNVNITFHIGNGSGGTPKVSPTDLQVEPKLSFGEEEETPGTLQQEAGKQFVMAVQETAG
uniref:Tumor necrosis factor receptor superfamily, member 1B n=1 Tax=Tetraodon nigroviridis TaxID=99883 RepID=H3DBD5_TETNG